MADLTHAMCPRCGADGQPEAVQDDTLHTWRIRCRCGMNTGENYFRSEEDAWMAWDTRPIEEVLRKQVEFARWGVMDGMLGLIH